MYRKEKALLALFIVLCAIAMLFTPAGGSESAMIVDECYITIEPVDGLSHEFYYVGDEVYLVAHIAVREVPATPTDLGSTYNTSDFDITWQSSPDGISWTAIGSGETYIVVLNAETVKLYYRFVATRK